MIKPFLASVLVLLSFQFSYKNFPTSKVSNTKNIKCRDDINSPGKKSEFQIGFEPTCTTQRYNVVFGNSCHGKEKYHIQLQLKSVASRANNTHLCFLFILLTVSSAKIHSKFFLQIVLHIFSFWFGAVWW